VNWKKLDSPMVSRPILVTKSEIERKKARTADNFAILCVETLLYQPSVGSFANPNLVSGGTLLQLFGSSMLVERVPNVMVVTQLETLKNLICILVFTGIYFGC